MTIDLQAYPLGTLFTYTPRKDWCRDSQAELREDWNGERQLVDTYWVSADSNSILGTDEAASAEFFFDPAVHREVSQWDAPVYGDAVTTIRRQRGSYTRHYVSLSTPELDLAARLTHTLAEAEQDLAEATAKVESQTRYVLHLRKQVSEAQAGG